MLKRFISCVVMIAVLFANAVTGFAVLPQNMFGSGGDGEKKLVYREDFTHGSGMWKLTNMSIMPGRLETSAKTFASADFFDETLK